MGESSSSQDVRRRYGVPDGVELCVDASEVLVCLPGYEVAVRAVAARPDDLPASGRGGRGALARIETDHGPVMVRPYRKGGLLRHVRGTLFSGSWRPVSEFVMHRRLKAVGVPVLEAVGCVVLRRALGWRGFLLTREIDGAVDLESWLYGVGRDDGDPRDILRHAGAAVRSLHDAGVVHPDLHPKNLLIAPDDTVLAIDLDKADPNEQPLDDVDRLNNLVRLGRSIEKHRLKGMETGRREALRFLEGYAGNREAAAAWLDRVRARLRRGLWLRTIWWRLIGEARPWRAPEARQ